MHRIAREDQDVAEGSGLDGGWEDRKTGGERVGKGRKGLGYRVRGGPGPGNTITVRELLSDERYIGAVLNFLRATKVGMVKEGVIVT